MCFKMCHISSMYGKIDFNVLSLDFSGDNLFADLENRDNSNYAFIIYSQNEVNLAYVIRGVYEKTHSDGNQYCNIDNIFSVEIGLIM